MYVSDFGYEWFVKLMIKKNDDQFASSFRQFWWFPNDLRGFRLVYEWTQNTNWTLLLIVSFFSNQFDYEKYIGDIGFKKESDTSQIFTVSIYVPSRQVGRPGLSRVPWTAICPIINSLNREKSVINHGADMSRDGSTY